VRANILQGKLMVYLNGKKGKGVEYINGEIRAYEEYYAPGDYTDER
jgi:hypothetical protein